MQIINTSLPQGAKAFEFNQYNGEGDPLLHIDSFLILYSEFHNPDFVLLKLVSLSLKGTMLEWYNSLSNYSIQIFDQLMDESIKIFQANIGNMVTIFTLFIKNKVE